MSYYSCGYYYSYKGIGNEPSDLRDIVIENPAFSEEKRYKNQLFEMLDNKEGLALLALGER